MIAPPPLETYARFATEHPTGKEAPAALLGAGRLLQGEAASGTRRGRCSSAPSRRATARWPPRPPIGSAKDCARPARNEEAADAYMTAAYVAPDSVWARRALLGAGRAFAAPKQNDAAVIVYKKLLAARASSPIWPRRRAAASRALGAS